MVEKIKLYIPLDGTAEELKTEVLYRFRLTRISIQSCIAGSVFKSSIQY